MFAASKHRHRIVKIQCQSNLLFWLFLCIAMRNRLRTLYANRENPISWTYLKPLAWHLIALADKQWARFSFPQSKITHTITIIRSKLELHGFIIMRWRLILYSLQFRWMYNRQAIPLIHTLVKPKTKFDSLFIHLFKVALNRSKMEYSKCRRTNTHRPKGERERERAHIRTTNGM